MITTMTRKTMISTMSEEDEGIGDENDADITESGGDQIDKSDEKSS